MLGRKAFARLLPFFSTWVPLRRVCNRCISNGLVLSCGSKGHRMNTVNYELGFYTALLPEPFVASASTALRSMLQNPVVSCCRVHVFMSCPCSDYSTSIIADGAMPGSCQAYPYHSNTPPRLCAMHVLAGTLSTLLSTSIVVNKLDDG